MIISDKRLQKTLGYGDILNLNMVGAGVMNGDVRKILLAVYEIVVEYAGQEYKIYLSNDGAKSAIESWRFD